jgi:hypothetical protein
MRVMWRWLERAGRPLPHGSWCGRVFVVVSADIRFPSTSLRAGSHRAFARFGMTSFFSLRFQNQMS